VAEHSPYSLSRRFVALSCLRGTLLRAVVLLSLSMCGGEPAEFRMIRLARPAGLSPQVLHAEPADPTDWPATLVFRTPAVLGCTSTIVGEHVVLTAAHCFNKKQQKGVVSLDYGDLSLTCDQDPAYSPGKSSDFALCYSPQVFQNVLGENLALAAEVPEGSFTVTLIGYGCTTADGADKDFGSLYLGAADVDITPGQSVKTAESFMTRGGAAVCSGDSGGGAYLGGAKSPRSIVGINARGDLDSYSLIVTTYSSGFVDWAKKWAGGKNVAICGLTANAKGCARTQLPK